MTGTEAATAVAAAIQITRASGALVRVEPTLFLNLVGRQEEPLVIRARGGLFQARWQYMTSYRSFIFYAKASEPLALPGRAEVLDAKKFWLPG